MPVLLLPPVLLRQDKFFDILTQKFDHARAIGLIEAAFSPDELKSMKECGSYRMRLDLDDDLSSIFQRLWNTPNARTKCRAILEIIKNRMLSTIRKAKADETAIRFRSSASQPIWSKTYGVWVVSLVRGSDACRLRSSRMRSGSRT